MHGYTHTTLQYFSLMFFAAAKPISICFYGRFEGSILSLAKSNAAFSKFDLLIHEVVVQALASSLHLLSDEVKVTKYMKAIYNKQEQELLHSRRL